PLDQFGLEYIYPEIAAAHPFDSGKAAALKQSIDETGASLGTDAKAYQKLMRPIVKDWVAIAPDVLGPLHYPRHPMPMAGFGLTALRSGKAVGGRFKTDEAKGFFGGMGAHSMQPLTKATTAAVALVLMASGHLKGWPLPRGGTHHIADALAAYFVSLGGK